MSFEFFPEESDRIAANATPLMPEDVEAPAFAGLGGELLRAPMRAFSSMGAAGALAVSGALRTHGIDQADETLFGVVDRFRQARDFWTAEPGEVGTAGRILGGLTEFGTLLGVGAGNPALAIGTTELSTAADLAVDNVSPGVAVTAGAVEAAGTAVAFRVPFLGKTLAQRLVLGAGANVAAGAATTGGVNLTLSGAGYDVQAERYDPWNVEARAVDAFAGALFGGIAHYAERATPQAREAAAVLNDHQHATTATAPGIPKTPEAIDAHVDAIRQAIGELGSDQPVTAAVDPALFKPDPYRTAVNEEVRTAAREEFGPEPRVDTPKPAPVEEQLGARMADLEKLPPDAAPIAPGLRQMFEAAARAKPQFDDIVRGIVAEVQGTVAQLADLKGVKRSFEKIRDDYAGDPTQIKDLVRGTIEVQSLQQAEAVLARISERFFLLPRGQRNLLRADVDPVDGYRDAKFNALVDGHVVELQVNVPSMLKAKKQVHGAYEARSKIERDSKGRERTPAEQAEIDRLNAEMKAVYDAAWTEATSSRNSGQDTGAPLRLADSGSNTRGSGLSQAADEKGQPGTLPSDTGMPSTSKSSTPGGAALGKDIGITSDARSIAEGDAALELSSAAQILSQSPDLMIALEDGTEIRAADALAAAESDVRQAQELGAGVNALATCALQFLGG